jgi:protein-disulfide isomerase
VRPIARLRLPLLLAALAIGPGCARDEPAVDAAPAVAGPAARDPGYTRGAPDAVLTVIELSDFGCPACRQFALDSYPALHSRYVETGKVRWRYVPFLAGNFPNADRATMAAECAADQDEALFWVMKVALYETQREWRNAGVGDAPFHELAARAGADPARFHACMESNAAARRIEAGNRMASLGSVTGTPTFLIDGRRALGALSAEQFGGLLDVLLAERGAAPR